MSSKSLSDIAYDRLKQKDEEVLFNELWNEVSSAAKFPENVAKRKVASFYNAIMLDSRFISLEGNKWDLRERHAEITLTIDPDLLEDYDDYEEDYEDEE
ncbi:DNA-directed RNA polymerase subunit delta [Erysipelothrix urinaevulpis]|uniref:DNA-directed RNA polymerase subunit delta n=1 Tax=Erysipelothrix urinaevulpis TaxID=2683717 RepID=UPI00135B2C65|nr:DNA-directed RNA polymerase subunit delta [Erysipelothrix urinaevulpis]